MKLWFTADTHFGHKAIIAYESRTFRSVAAMDETIVKNWNSVVGKHDVVWHLGDFSFCDPAGYVAQLNGKICLCLGNHDHRRLTQIKRCISVIHEAVQVEVRGTKIWLSHYAHRTWPSKPYGSIHLYGHSHGKLAPEPSSMDVGVDTNDFKPYSADQVLKLLLTQRQRCQKCHGRGLVEIKVLDASADFECPDCNGTGSVVIDKCQASSTGPMLTTS